MPTQADMELNGLKLNASLIGGYYCWIDCHSVLQQTFHSWFYSADWTCTLLTHWTLKPAASNQIFNVRQHFLQGREQKLTRLCKHGTSSSRLQDHYQGARLAAQLCAPLRAQTHSEIVRENSSWMLRMRQIFGAFRTVFYRVMHEKCNVLLNCQHLGKH